MVTCKEKRSYQATGNKLRELKEEVFPAVEGLNQSRGKYYVRTEREEYHAAKKLGTLQIDMMYIPLECYCEAISSPESVVKLRQRVITEARTEIDVVISAYQEEIQKNPDVQEFLLALCKEAEKEYQQIYADIMSCTPEELLPRRFYQYTAVDECTGWAYRQIYITHSEASAMLFMAEVYEQAPFKIEKVQTDNGSEFTSKYLNNHGPDYETPFEQYLTMMRIHYYRIQPGKPWQNGRVECQHRLDRERFYRRIRFSSLEEAQELLAKYNEESNNYYRPSRGGKSAMEQLREFQIGDET